MKILCITPHNKFDYLSSSIIEGLKENNHEIYCTDYGNGVEKVYTDEKGVKWDREWTKPLNFYQSMDLYFTQIRLTS